MRTLANLLGASVVSTLLSGCGGGSSDPKPVQAPIAVSSPCTGSTETTQDRVAHSFLVAHAELGALFPIVLRLEDTLGKCPEPPRTRFASELAQNQHDLLLFAEQLGLIEASQPDAGAGESTTVRMRDVEQRLDELKDQIRRAHTRLALISDATASMCK
ncbi:MAG: hypothetical protein ACLQVI_37615 [Polyangiaceae bacterium]